MAGEFNSAKHPRAAGGRFGVVGKSVGADRLKTSGVLGNDLIKVLSPRMRKYAGFKTVEEFVAAHPKGRAHALRLLAADHKAGKVAFVAAEAKIASKGGHINRSTLRPIGLDAPGGIKDSDYVFSHLKKYPEGGTTVGDFVKSHPKGEKHARKLIIADVKAGRASLERPISDFPKVARPAKASLQTKSQRGSTKGIQFGPDVSEGFKDRVAEGWNAIPDKVKQLTAAHGVTVHAPLRLIDVSPELANMHPRGWSAGSTWKEVGGVYSGGGGLNAPKVIVAETVLRRDSGKFTPEFRGQSVICHEMGHALDAAGGNLSSTSEFRAAYAADLAAYDESGYSRGHGSYQYFMQPENDYHGGRSEMFAEMFADKLGYPTNYRDPPLSKRFPKCAKFMDALIKGLS